MELDPVAGGDPFDATGCILMTDLIENDAVGIADGTRLTPMKLDAARHRAAQLTTGEYFRDGLAGGATEGVPIADLVVVECTVATQEGNVGAAHGSFTRLPFSPTIGNPTVRWLSRAGWSGRLRDKRTVGGHKRDDVSLAADSKRMRQCI